MINLSAHLPKGRTASSDPQPGNEENACGISDCRSDAALPCEAEMATPVPWIKGTLPNRWSNQSTWANNQTSSHA
jgi:hypothetical protein